MEKFFNNGVFEYSFIIHRFTLIRLIVLLGETFLFPCKVKKINALV